MSRGIRDLREIICVSRLGYSQSSDESGSNDEDDDDDEASEMINHNHCSKLSHQSNYQICSSASTASSITKVSQLPQESGKRYCSEKLTSRYNSIAIGNSKVSLQRPSSAFVGSSDSQRYGKSVFLTLAAGKSNSEFSPRSQLCNSSGVCGYKSSGVDIRPYSARNYDDLLVRVNSSVLSSWLEEANLRVRRMDCWCRMNENFVRLAHIWLNEVTDKQKSKLINQMYRRLVENLSLIFSNETSGDLVMNEVAQRAANTARSSFMPSGASLESTRQDKFNFDYHIDEIDLNADNNNSQSISNVGKYDSKLIDPITEKPVNSGSKNGSSLNVDRREIRSKKNGSPLRQITADIDIDRTAINSSSASVSCSKQGFSCSNIADTLFNVDSCSSGLSSCSSSRITSSSSCGSRKRAEASATESGYSDNINIDDYLDNNDSKDSNEKIPINSECADNSTSSLSIEMTEASISDDHQSVQQQQHNISPSLPDSALVAFLGAIFREYPTRMLGVKGSNLFLDYLDVLTGDRSSRYRALLSDVKCWTDEPAHAQSILAIRSAALVTVWSEIVAVVRQRLERESGRGEEETGEGARDEDQTGMNARRIYQAIRLDYVDVVRYLLMSGKVSPKLVDSQGKSLVFHSVISNSPSVLHFLISEVAQGVDVNISARNGNTALHAASNVGSVRLVTELLLAKDLHVDEPNLQCDNATPLHVAVMQGHVEVVRLLVEAGADRTLKMGDSTPIDLARDFQHSEILDFLQP